MTAREFLKQYLLNNAEKGVRGRYDLCMAEFAKFHVEQALKTASEKAYVEYKDLKTEEVFDYTDVITNDGVGADVNKKSILNAYPLESIK